MPEGRSNETIRIRLLTSAPGNRTIPELSELNAGGQRSRPREHRCEHMNKEEFKKFHQEHLKVPVAGFGMAAVLLVIYLTVMTWLAGQVHLMQSSIDRFSH